MQRKGHGAGQSEGQEMIHLNKEQEIQKLQVYIAISGDNLQFFLDPKRVRASMSSSRLIADYFKTPYIYKINLILQENWNKKLKKRNLILSPRK